MGQYRGDPEELESVRYDPATGRFYKLAYLPMKNRGGGGGGFHPPRPPVQVCALCAAASPNLKKLAYDSPGQRRAHAALHCTMLPNANVTEGDVSVMFPQCFPFLAEEATVTTNVPTNVTNTTNVPATEDDSILIDDEPASQAEDVGSSNALDAEVDERASGAILHCGDCTRPVTGTRETLDEHVLEHLGRMGYACGMPRCGKQFPTRVEEHCDRRAVRDLRPSFQANYREALSTCFPLSSSPSPPQQESTSQNAEEFRESVGESVPTVNPLQELKTHLSRVTRIISQYSGILYCSRKGASSTKYKDTSKLLGHVLSHTGITIYQCKLCDEEATPNSVYRHFRIKHDIRNVNKEQHYTDITAQKAEDILTGLRDCYPDEYLERVGIKGESAEMVLAELAEKRAEAGGEEEEGAEDDEGAEDEEVVEDKEVVEDEGLRLSKAVAEMEMEEEEEEE